MKTVKRPWLAFENCLGPVILFSSFAGLVSCFFVSWYSWWVIALFFLLGIARWYFLGIIGVSVGYHRLLAHHLEKKAPFKTSSVMKSVFAILGIMAFISPPNAWTAAHRQHHARSDGEGDPHSPVHGYTGHFAKLRGFFNVQIGAFFKKSALSNYQKTIPDLLRDPAVQFVEKTKWVWIFAGVALPAVIGGAITWSILGIVWHGMFFGVLTLLASTFILHQLINSVNSYSHMFGIQRFPTNDNSKNVSGVIGWILCFFNGGEPNQNSHHYFPWSARLVLPGDHGIDLGWPALKFLKKLGHIWDLKEPTLAQIRAAELTRNTA